MTDPNLITQIQSLIRQHHDRDVVFSTLVSALGQVLECDRCFLYLRHPDTQMGKITHCWVRSHEYPDMTDPDWKPEPAHLPQEDPMFAAALRAEDSIYVEDVETADPSVVNLQFERENFGHRALIHAHLRQGDRLWGILQPCIFGHPRIWTASDRQLMTQVEQTITPLIISFVQNAPMPSHRTVH